MPVIDVEFKEEYKYNNFGSVTMIKDPTRVPKDLSELPTLTSVDVSLINTFIYIDNNGIPAKISLGQLKAALTNLE